MKMPIVDFVRRYADSAEIRAHMPGHKGVPLLGFESLDITEFDGADDLYAPQGIIAQSEQNASDLFGCRTFYSTEGSSQCIRAMLFLARQYAQQQGRAARVIAGRNAHKVFVSAAALLDIEVSWLKSDESYLSCALTVEDVQAAIEREHPVAVYLTSPDYLGNTVDIAAIAAVCHRNKVLLLVDNAHGAYLKFLNPSRHPVDLGADLCCDSAHKTLPALTGAAYLHIAPSVEETFAPSAKAAMALFGSTSPSYLILQSLDAVNGYLANGYADRLAQTVCDIAALRQTLADNGYVFVGDEPLKLTFDAKAYGYRGEALAAAFYERGIVSEFCDPDYVVWMLTPENGDLSCFAAAATAIPSRCPITEVPPALSLPMQAMSAKTALFAAHETVAAEDAVGRVLGQVTVGCPPAVPIVMCGERVDREAVEVLRYYGIAQCTVVKE